MSNPLICTDVSRILLGIIAHKYFYTIAFIQKDNAHLSVSAGVPPGVVNMVFGAGPRAGDALVGHPEVPLVSFTGSTATAQRITERSAPYCKKLSLELGGKNPAVIFADANLDQCIETTIRSSFTNQVREKCLGVFF